MENPVKKIKRVHPPSFKAKVALEGLKEQKTIQEISSQYGIHSTQVVKWKKAALEGLPGVFGEGKKQEETDYGELTDELYKQIGQLKVQMDFLKKKIGIIERE